jgi:hypothetical protein
MSVTLTSSQWAEFTEKEWTWVEGMLFVLADNEPDNYERFTFREPVRSDKIDFCCRNRCDSGHHKSQWKPYPTKRKEVK